MSTDTVWSDDKVNSLKKMWGEGLSATQIAIKLGGGITRNAVIGKVHRLNLSGRNNGRRTQKKLAIERPKQQETVLQSTVPVKAKFSLPPVSTEDKLIERIPVAPLPAPKPIELRPNERVTILHLSDKTCKWPIGDPRNPDFCFCGHTPRDGCAYCEYHMRMANQPKTAKKYA